MHQLGTESVLHWTPRHSIADNMISCLVESILAGTESIPISTILMGFVVYTTFKWTTRLIESNIWAVTESLPISTLSKGSVVHTTFKWINRLIESKVQCDCIKRCPLHCILISNLIVSYIHEEGRQRSKHGHRVGVLPSSLRKHPGQLNVRQHDEHGQHSGHGPHDERQTDRLTVDDNGDRWHEDSGPVDNQPVVNESLRIALMFNVCVSYLIRV